MSAIHTFQVNNSSIVSINSSGIYIGSKFLSSTVLGYLNTCTSSLRSQLDSKQAAGTYATQSWLHNQSYLILIASNSEATTA